MEEEGEEELAGDAVSCTGGEDEQVLGLGGSQLNLGDLLPHDKIDFDATIVDVSYLSEKERSVAAPVMPPEDARAFHLTLGTLQRASLKGPSLAFTANHSGVLIAALHGVTVVHDGVICNASHALTAMAAKHNWHPRAHEIRGCQLPDSDPSIRITGTALLLVRYMGWFWGHFCQDLLYRLAWAVDYLEGKGGGGAFSVIVESQSNPGVLDLIKGVLGGEANSRVLFMPTSCLRGNARECPFYFRPRELVLVEQFPKVVGVKSSFDDVQDMFPPGIRRAAARLSSFFATRVAQLNRARAMVRHLVRWRREHEGLYSFGLRLHRHENASSPGGSNSDSV